MADQTDDLPQRYVAKSYEIWRGKGGAPDLLALAMIQAGITILRETVGPGNWADDLEALAKWSRDTNETGGTGARTVN